jgi:hypothetical protein
MEEPGGGWVQVMMREERDGSVPVVEVEEGKAVVGEGKRHGRYLQHSTWRSGGTSTSSGWGG